MSNNYTFFDLKEPLSFSDFYQHFSESLAEIGFLNVTANSLQDKAGVVEIQDNSLSYELSFILDYDKKKKAMSGILAVLAIRKKFFFFSSTEKLDYQAPFYLKLIEALNHTELCSSITQEPNETESVPL